jgi:hypothetical protein
MPGRAEGGETKFRRLQPFFCSRKSFNFYSQTAGNAPPRQLFVMRGSTRCLGGVETLSERLVLVGSAPYSLTFRVGEPVAYVQVLRN